MSEERRPPGEKKRRSETVVLKEAPVREDGKIAVRIPYLVLLHPPGAEIGKRFQLERERYGVGRDSASDIPLERESVSRAHAELIRTGRGSWKVRDLGSTNGMLVDGNKAQQATLYNGSTIKIGNTTMTVSLVTDDE